MKKYISILACAILALASCSKNGIQQSAKAPGYLVFNEYSFQIDESVITKAVEEAKGNFSIQIFNGEGTRVVNTIYSSIRDNGYKLSLEEGHYHLVASSDPDGVPASGFENPVYGIEKDFDIVSAQETAIGSLVCTLLQTKVSVSYSDDFLTMVTGDCVTRVTVTEGSPLEYRLNYSEGKRTFEQRVGYFAVNNPAGTTMEVAFSGSVEGKTQKMTRVFTNVEPRTWHQIKFIRQINPEGNADIAITINDLIADETLENDVQGGESILGPDPDAPAGDGGIELQSTCAIDITKDIVVPAMGNPFSLTMKAVVPGKVKKFTVEIQSTNPAFIASVAAVNDGQSTLDLVEPSQGAIGVFTEILPFPYGEAVKDKSEIDFNLSDAQEPILAFAGKHTFVMHVVDCNGCKKDIPIVMVVE